MSAEPLIAIYIDEAGDPGVRDGIKYYRDRYEWLSMGAVALRTEHEPNSVEWVRQMREEARSRQGPALHYAEVTPARRASMCAILATKPVRAFCVLSHKSNLREYENPKLGRLNDAKLYNWCMRLLLERVMEWAAPIQLAERGSLEPLSIVFSKRGGHDYEHMFSYFARLNMQYETDTMVLRPRTWLPALLERKALAVEHHGGRAGLQLADVVASAFYQGVNTVSPKWAIEPAVALRPIMARDKAGDKSNFGVTVWPLAHQAPVPEASRGVFERFGYRFG